MHTQPATQQQNLVQHWTKYVVEKQGTMLKNAALVSSVLLLLIITLLIFFTLTYMLWENCHITTNVTVFIASLKD